MKVLSVSDSDQEVATPTGPAAGHGSRNWMDVSMDSECDMFCC